MHPKIIRRKKLVEDSIRDCINRPIILINPASITDDFLLKVKPAEIEEIEWVDKCRWIIHSIIIQQLSLETDYDNPYAPLHSCILKANLGNYTVFINTLIAERIIECDNKYSIIGGKSKGYRLATNHHFHELLYFRVRCKKLIKAIKSQRKKKANQLMIKAKHIAHVVYWLTTNDLKIDKKSARELLENYKKTYLANLEQLTLTPKEIEQAMYHLERSYFYARYRIEHFNTNNFTIDGGGRLYCSLTNLPSIYRNFLSYKGKRLVSVDIKNSHPFHMLFLLQSKFWQNKGEITLHKIDSKLSKIEGASPIYKRYANPPPVLSCRKTLIQLIINILK